MKLEYDLQAEPLAERQRVSVKVLVVFVQGLAVPPVAPAVAAAVGRVGVALPADVDQLEGDAGLGVRRGVQAVLLQQREGLLVLEGDTDADVLRHLVTLITRILRAPE